MSLSVNGVTISEVVTNKTGNKCVDVDAVKDGKRVAVFRCLVTINLPQYKTAQSIASIIASHKKAHPETANTKSWRLVNDKIQPNFTTGNLSGLDVELILGPHGELRATKESGEGLKVESPIKLSNRGYIRGGGGRGGTGGTGGTSSSKKVRAIKTKYAVKHYIKDYRRVKAYRERHYQMAHIDTGHGYIDVFFVAKRTTTSLNGGKLNILNPDNQDIFMVGYSYSAEIHVPWESKPIIKSWTEGELNYKIGGIGFKTSLSMSSHTFKATELKAHLEIFAGNHIVYEDITVPGKTGGGGGNGGEGATYSRPTPHAGYPGVQGSYNTAKGSHGYRSGNGGTGGAGGTWGKGGSKGGTGGASEDKHAGYAGSAGGKAGPAIIGAKLLKSGSTTGKVSGAVLQ